MEKIIHKNLEKHLENNNILTTRQGGYRKGKSTIDTVAQFTDDITHNRNMGNITIATYADFSKAFDTVDHLIMLEKFKKYGVKGNFLKLFTNYLENRSQYTKVNGVISKEAKVTRGVPQGSVLGPTLFSLYVNDMVRVFSKCKVLLYADDTVIYKSGPDIDSIQTDMQPDLTSFSTWCKGNKLSLNIGKTKSTVFIPSFRGKDNIRPNLEIDNIQLQYVHCYKYLGVTIDNKLTFKQHVNQTIKNVAFRSYTMAKAQEYLPKYALLKVYKSYILPIFDQGDILYDGHCVDQLKKLQKLQNRCLKVCEKVPFRTPTLEVHKSTKVPYLSLRRQAHIRNYAFKRSKDDTYIEVMNRRTRLADAPILKCDLAHCTAYERSVKYKTAQSWNNLDVSVRNIVESQEFKLRTKTDLLTNIVEGLC